MQFDFAAILVALTFATGIIWGLDRLLFAKGRAAAAPAGENAREPILVEYARSFFPVILIVLVFRSFLAEPFRIPSGSMMPTLLVGDFILVNKFAYGLRLPVLDKKMVAIGEPERGDVIVFRFPKDPSQDYIKRVIGLPGDEIVYRDKVLSINGKEVPRTYIEPYSGIDEESRALANAGTETMLELLPEIEHRILEIPGIQRGPAVAVTVPKGHYFVMGDNRDNSQDSRFWGFVPEQNLVGKAFVIWMSWRGWKRGGFVEFGRIGTLIK
jgi:signal peptidase I